MQVTLLDKENKVNELWQRWGRQSDRTHDYIDTPEARERIAKRCLKSFHWAQSENVYFDFDIRGVSVGIFMPQILHHPIGVSSGIKSYRTPRNVLDFWIPDSIKYRQDQTLVHAYQILFSEAVRLYNKALDEGIPAQEARACLPLSLKTDLIWCADLEAIQKLCQDRLCHKADTESQEFARLLRKEMLSMIPELEVFFGPKCWVYGQCFESPSCGRPYLGGNND